MGRRRKDTGPAKTGDGLRAASAASGTPGFATPAEPEINTLEKKSRKSDAQAQQQSSAGTPVDSSGDTISPNPNHNSSKRKRSGGPARSVPIVEITHRISSRAAQPVSAKRRRTASTSKGPGPPASDSNSPHAAPKPPYRQGQEVPTYATVTARPAGAPAPGAGSHLDALIQAKIDARAQAARMAQTTSTPKDRLDAIISAKVKARADLLRSPSTPASPATLAAAATSTPGGAPISHHRPLARLASGVAEGSSPEHSDPASQARPAGRPKRSKPPASARATSKKLLDVGDLQAYRDPRVQDTPERSGARPHTSDNGMTSSPHVQRSGLKHSVSVPNLAEPARSGSSPADDLSARIEAKIRARAEKAEHRRLSLGHDATQVTTPAPTPADALTAKIHAKIQARAQVQALRQAQAIQQALLPIQAFITESLSSSVGHRPESGTPSVLVPPSVTWPPHKAPPAKTSNAEAKQPKQRKHRKNKTKASSPPGLEWAPPSGPAGSMARSGLAGGEGLRQSRDVSPVSPHMAPPSVSPVRRSLILSDSDSSSASSSPTASPRLFPQQSQSRQLSRTSSASVSDILPSSAVEAAPSSPPSEMTFMVPSSPAAPGTTATAHAQESLLVTGMGVSASPQLIRAGPRWTVTTPRQ